MPSIFVWKAVVPNPSKKNIRYYAGSNWVVEDTDYSSRSYQYLQQIVIPGSNGDSVITFLAKTMPQDWVGSELLEVCSVPYHLYRSDEYATLEHIGNWMRVTLKRGKSDVEWTLEHLQAQWNNIKQWMKQPSNTSLTPLEHRPPVIRREHHTHQRATTMHPSRPPITAPSIPVAQAHTIDPVQVQKSFQEFYAKVGAPPRHHAPRDSHRPRPPRH